MKRIATVFMLLCLLLTVLPVGVFATETAEIQVGAQYILHGEAEFVESVFVDHLDRLDIIQQGWAFVPRCTTRALDNVVALESRQWETGDVGD